MKRSAACEAPGLEGIHAAPETRPYKTGFRRVEQGWYWLRLRRLKTWRARGRWLDVGCGSGGFLQYLSRRGWEADGVDPYPQAGQEREPARGYRLFSGALAEARYPAATFDVITLWHVLEHLPEPVPVLQEVVRILKPSGVVMIATPNAASWERRLFGRHWFYWHPPQHCILYEPGTLARLLGEVGLRVVGLSFSDLEYNLAGWLQSAAHWLGAEPYELRNLLKGSVRPAQVTRSLRQAYSWLVAVLVVAGAPFAVSWVAITALCRRSGCFVAHARRDEDFP
ncbi:MAG: class I SAM-dependent methyltransferase [Candidatus Omnitrophica bacterium]|nr:class I SAM-dependent methyltransferase [Candidatus Omnitrophota bacterium]